MLGFELPSLSNPGEEKALEILRELTCALTEMYTDIYNDPPDPQYFTVGSPSFNSLPTGLPSSALLTALDRQGAFGETMLKSYERYQGAKAAAQKPFVHAQSNAVFENGFAQLSEITATVKALRAEATRMEGLPAFDGPVATAASKADLTALYTRVKNDGFTIGETAQLVALGLTATADRRPPKRVLTRPLVVPGRHDAARDPPLDRGRACVDGAGLRRVPPQRRARARAARTSRLSPPSRRRPTTARRPLTVHFTDTSTSSDLDPLTREWDFGDGSTATGASVDHTYTHALNYVATLTVSDDLLSNSVSHTIHVTGHGRRRPEHAPDGRRRHARDALRDAGSRRRARKRQRPRRRRSDRLLVHERRPRLGRPAWRTPARAATHRSPGYTGADQFTYTASDGRGGTATANVAVTVQPVAGTPPNANTDNLVLLAGGSGSVNVLLNDTDQNHDPLTVTAFSQGTLRHR